MNFQFIPPQASEIAKSVDTISVALLILSAFFAIIIFAALIIFILKYHDAPLNNAVFPKRNTTYIEVLWTVVPVGILLGVFVWGTKLFIQINTPPADAQPVYVVAKQWMWKFEHPEGAREINELHIPMGYPIKLIMISKDVIHSFFVPAFRVKADVLPGQYTSLWFNPNRVGVYDLFCSQYCGTDHSQMIGKIIVMRPQDFNLWLGQKQTSPSATPGAAIETALISGGEPAISGAGSPISPTESQAAAGEKLFHEKACTSCHDKGIGPNLHGLFGSTVLLNDGRKVVANENYIRECIFYPGTKMVKGYANIMPPFKGQLSESQVMTLIQYIKSLKSSSGEKSNKKENP